MGIENELLKNPDMNLKEFFEYINSKKDGDNGYYIMMCEETKSYDYVCFLPDEEVRYGTDNYDLLVESLKKVFKPKVLNQVLNNKLVGSVMSYSIYIDMGTPSRKKPVTLAIMVYDKKEYEEVKYYKKQQEGCRFKFW